MSPKLPDEILPEVQILISLRRTETWARPFFPKKAIWQVDERWFSKLGLTRLVGLDSFFCERNGFRKNGINWKKLKGLPFEE